MATPPVATGATCTMLLAAVLGCSSSDSYSAPQQSSVTFAEVDLEVRVPARLGDLTYSVGESEEGQPALYFSTEQMASVGGPSCAAGAEAAVSPYPLGQVVVSKETPEHVYKEARENPEENLGRYVKQVGDRYLYYVSPPAESCVSGDAEAAKLQRALTIELRSALETLRSATGR